MNEKEKLGRNIQYMYSVSLDQAFLHGQALNFYIYSLFPLLVILLNDTLDPSKLLTTLSHASVLPRVFGITSIYSQWVPEWEWKAFAIAGALVVKVLEIKVSRLT